MKRNLGEKEKKVEKGMDRLVKIKVSATLKRVSRQVWLSLFRQSLLLPYGKRR